MNQFSETRKLFLSAIDYDIEKPWDYDQWFACPDEYKSAVIYLQFYETITLAWEHTKNWYTPTDTAVSLILQYLEKNVAKILEDPTKFNPRYIYRVAFNCLQDECQYRLRTQRQAENEISENGISSSNEEYSFFDFVPGNTFDAEWDAYNFECMTEEFWEVLEDLDVDSKVLLEKFLGTPYEEIADVLCAPELSGKRLISSSSKRIQMLMDTILQKFKDSKFDLHRFIEYSSLNI